MINMVFVESDREIKKELKNYFPENKFEYSMEEGEHCYLIENQEIKRENFENFYKSLFNQGIKFSLTIKDESEFEETSQPNYEEKCIVREYVPNEYKKEKENTIRKLCAIVFHSQQEKIKI